MLATGAVLLLAACAGSNPAGPGGLGADQSVREHLVELVGLMREHSVRRLEIEWTSFEAAVLEAAGGADTIPEAFPAIREALARLDDGHTSYDAATGGGVFVQKYACAGNFSLLPELPPSIGYVKVGAFSGQDAAATAYANEIQDVIRAADGDGVVSWIVDLRGNGGGNVWPMTAGLGPILGEGVYGYAVRPSGVEISREYRDGASWSGPIPRVRVADPYHLRHERPRVAVLIDGAVASSGEATAIAFIGRPDTRSFGLPTCGLSTGVATFTMTNGARLHLAVSIMADRNQVPYEAGVPVDELIPTPRAMVDRAVEWLLNGA